MNLQLSALDNCPLCGGSGSIGSTEKECSCAIASLAPEDAARYSRRINDGDYTVVPSAAYDARMERIFRQQSDTN